MHSLPTIYPTMAELAEIERLDAIIKRLSQRADNGPRGLAFAALAAGAAVSK